MDKDLLISIIQQKIESKEVITSSDNIKAFKKIKDCRTHLIGGRVEQCSSCNTKEILYNPCNKRGCPKCATKNKIRWILDEQLRSLPVGHYLLSISLPDKYTKIWLSNKKEVIDSLFRCSSKVTQTLYQLTGLLFGCTVMFQSHGKGMCYKPHLHMLLTCGGVDQYGLWHKYGSINYNAIKSVYLEMFHVELEKRLMVLPNYFAETKDEQNQWVVFPTIDTVSGDSFINYIARGMTGVVNDIDKVYQDGIGNESITFTEIHGNKENKTTLPINTYVERYLNHIPPSNTVIVRHYGLYSNRRRKQVKSLIQKMEGCESPPEKPKHVQLCKHCHSEMTTVEKFCRVVNTEYFKKFGFSHGPPEHGATIKI